MNRVLPQYASAFVDRHGVTRIRLRRTGWPSIYINDAPGTPEFTAAYKAWEKSQKVQAGEGRTTPGSFNDLITKFYASARFGDVKPQTQRTYRGELDRFRARYGERSAATIEARHIANLLSRMRETPSAANNLRKRLKQLFDFAILLGIRPDNPVAPVPGFKIKTGGYLTWQEGEIAKFEARWPRGTMERLAFDLALYTGQRKSDVRRMGPQHIKNGRIAVTQVKTGKDLQIPIHPELAKSISATPSGHLAFVVSSRGTARTSGSFGNWFRDACREAGLDGYSLHGLRKACARRMAEMGLSNQLIKSITGHSSDNEVARYTRDAEQVVLADRAMDLSTRAKSVRQTRKLKR